MPQPSRDEYFLLCRADVEIVAVKAPGTCFVVDLLVQQVSSAAGLASDCPYRAIDGCVSISGGSTEHTVVSRACHDPGWAAVITYSRMLRCALTCLDLYDAGSGVVG